MSQFPYSIVDLSHVLDADVPSWDNSCGFRLQTVLNYSDCTGAVTFRVDHVQLHAGVGTHVDAPRHSDPKGRSISELLLVSLITPCVVIDVRKKVKMSASYCITLEDVAEFENMYGSIQSNTCVFFNTGWDHYWFDRDTYNNHQQFPSIDLAVAQYLLNRHIVGIGIDTLGPDTIASGFPVHGLLLSKGKYIIENVTNLSALPPVGAFSCCLPLSIANGTESPTRLVAFVPCL